MDCYLLFPHALFFILSGLFAKAESYSTAKSVVKLMFLYIVMTVVVTFAHCLMTGDSLSLHLLTPVFSAWFFQVLIIARLLLPVLQHIKHVVVVLLLISLITPFFDSINSFLSLSRLAYYLPFFMLGYTLRLEGLYKIRSVCKRNVKIALSFVAILVLTGIIVLVEVGFIPVEYLWANVPYQKMGISNPLCAIALRALFIVVAFYLSFVLLIVLPSYENPTSYIGRNSLSVYVLQAAFTKAFVPLNVINPFVTGWIYVLISVVFCLVFALAPFYNLLDRPATFFSKKAVEKCIT